MKNHWYFDNFDFEKKSTNPHEESILKNGYTIIENSVESNLIDVFLEDYEKFKESTLSKHKEKLNSEDLINDKYRRLVNLHLVIPSLSDLFCFNKALEVTDNLFSSPTTLYTSLYYEIGSGQSLHRDTPYFWTNPGYGYFGVWLALEDVDDENGALNIVPESHKILDSFEFREILGKKFIENGSINPYSSELWDEYQKTIKKECDTLGLKQKSISIKKGSTLIWHPQLMHGGLPVKNKDRSRHSFVSHVTPKNYEVFAQDKYFNPNQNIDGLNDSIIYKSIKGRDIRHHDLWAIAQKIYLPTVTL